MIAVLAFPFIAALLVFAAGRKDSARDPRLTLSLLLLLAAFPLMAMWMPKLAILPTPATTQSGESFPWSMLLFSVWAVGFLIAMARLALAAIGLRRWHKRAVGIGSAENIPVMMLEGLRSPVAAGIFRPVIFVPKHWDDMPEEKRAMILDHEIAHHRRRDPLRRLCAELACAIHWYHPLVRWMAARFSLQCEYACDADVLSKGADAKTYARLLCDLAATPKETPVLAMAMAEGSFLEHRVGRMMRPGSGPETAVIRLCTGIGLVAALALSMLGGKSSETPSDTEVRLRLSADPFPAER